MTVSTTWTAPIAGGSLDLAAGTVVTETHWDALVSDFLYLGGPAGQITAVHSATVSTSGPTTTSTSFVDIPDLSIIATIGGTAGVSANCFLLFDGAFAMTSAASAFFSLQIIQGASTVLAQRNITSAGANVINSVVIHVIVPSVSSGSQLFKVRWSVSAGTLTADSTTRAFSMLELRR